jgi:hypothetical protein
MVKGVLQAKSNSITTAPTMSGGANDALRDIKPPVELPDPLKWVIIAAVVLIAAVAAWLLWRYWQKRRAQVPPIPIIPAHVRARRKLEEALALIGHPREFCITVSDTIRGYLEERFSFRAPERTTEEFLYELRQTNLLTPDQKDGLGEFLKRCDLVKFAKYEPREPELRDLHGSALRLVDETEPVVETGTPPPLPPPALAAAGSHGDAGNSPQS